MCWLQGDKEEFSLRSSPLDARLVTQLPDQSRKRPRTDGQKRSVGNGGETRSKADPNQPTRLQQPPIIGNTSKSRSGGRAPEGVSNNSRGAQRVIQLKEPSRRNAEPSYPSTSDTQEPEADSKCRKRFQPADRTPDVSRWAMYMDQAEEWNNDMRQPRSSSKHFQEDEDANCNIKTTWGNDEVVE